MFIQTVTSFCFPTNSAQKYTIFDNKQQTLSTSSILSFIHRIKMAFNQNQLTAFFTNAPQMGLTNQARVRLAGEGLATIDDFLDFKPDAITAALKNLRTSVPGIPAVVEVLDDQNNIIVPAVPAVPPVLPCIIPARCALRLKVASTAYHYYTDTSRTPTPQNMNYTNVLRSFYTEWEAITQQSEEDSPTVPVLSRSQTPIRWLESFKDCLYRTYGVRNCPLSYVIRDTVAVADEDTVPLLQGMAHSEQAGSVLQEMIDRFSHTHPLFRTDNNKVYSLLDEATRGTIYAPTIKPYARTKNGRAAWMAIVGSHAGDDKWEQIQKNQMKFLINNKWNGRQFGLDKFTNLHRTAYVSLEEAALHVTFQLPNEHTRVGYLLDNITSSDPALQAALSSVRADTNGMRGDFEKAVTFLLPTCPYARSSKSKSNGNNAIVSDATLQGQGASKTGVDLRWYKKAEYDKLTKEQRAELYEWQQTKQGKKVIEAQKKQLGVGPSKRNAKKKNMQARIAALEKELKDRDEAGGKDSNTTDDSSQSFTAEEVRAMISEFKKRPSIYENIDTGDSAASIQLSSILKRSRN